MRVVTPPSGADKPAIPQCVLLGATPERRRERYSGANSGNLSFARPVAHLNVPVEAVQHADQLMTPLAYLVDVTNNIRRGPGVPPSPPATVSARLQQQARLWIASQNSPSQPSTASSRQ